MRSFNIRTFLIAATYVMGVDSFHVSGHGQQLLASYSRTKIASICNGRRDEVSCKQPVTETNCKAKNEDLWRYDDDDKGWCFFKPYMSKNYKKFNECYWTDLSRLSKLLYYSCRMDVEEE